MAAEAGSRAGPPGRAAALLAAALGLAPVLGARAQEATTDAPRGSVAIGIEEQGIEAALRAIIDRQRTLEEGLRALEARLNAVAGTANETAARLERGDEPLVSLEIEQLWAMVGSLERDNAVLRERLDALGAPVGE